MVEFCSVLARLNHLVEAIGELDRVVTDARLPHGASHPDPMWSATEASASECVGEAAVRVDTVEDDDAWLVSVNELFDSIFEQFVPLVGCDVEVSG